MDSWIALIVGAIIHIILTTGCVLFGLTIYNRRSKSGEGSAVMISIGVVTLLIVVVGVALVLSNL